MCWPGGSRHPGHHSDMRKEKNIVIRHIFMPPLKAGVIKAQLDEAVRLLRELPAVVPEIKAFTAGRNPGLYQNEMQLVLTADFNDLAGRPPWKIQNILR